MGAKVNLNLNHLILPCKINCDTEYQSLRVLRPISSRYLRFNLLIRSLNFVLIQFAVNELTVNDDEVNDTKIHEVVIPEENPWLLGFHLAKGEEEVLLTSTAADALVARQHLSVPTMCLPIGILWNLISSDARWLLLPLMNRET